MSNGQLPLSGKVAIVTGSARNIGRATVLALAADGANIVVNALQDRAAAARVVGEVESLGARAVLCMGDVSDGATATEIVRSAVDRLGGVDILVCNASQRAQKPFLEMTYEEWRRVIDISLDGAFHLAQ